MIDLNKLKDLKGAPITIVAALLLCKRNVSATFLAEQTEYNYRTVTKALKLLQDEHIVIKTGYASYMLAAYQLPLSWDEKIERLPEANEGYALNANGSVPDAELQGRVEDLESRVRNLEEELRFGTRCRTSALNAELPAINAEVIEAEGSAENTESSVLDTEVSVPDAEPVNRLINNAPDNLVCWLDIDTNQPTEKSIDVNLTTGSGETPEETGDFPKAEVAWKTAANQLSCDLLRGAVLEKYHDGRFTVALDNPHKVMPATRLIREKAEEILTTIIEQQASIEFTARPAIVKPIDNYPAPSLELLPVPVYETYPNEIKNTEVCNEYLVDPTGIMYSDEDLHVLISCGPDPEVLQYILPKATCLENAKRWAELDLVKAKRNLLKKHGIIGAAASQISHNQNAKLEMIDKICSELCPDKCGLAIDRINKLAEEPILEM